MTCPILRWHLNVSCRAEQTVPLLSTMSVSQNPFEHLKKDLVVGDKTYQYYSLPDLKDARLGMSATV